MKIRRLVEFFSEYANYSETGAFRACDSLRWRLPSEIVNAHELLVARLRAEMAHRGWSKKRLAQAVGKTPSWMTDFLDGGIGKNLGLLDDISRGLGIPLDDLFVPVVAHPDASSADTPASATMAAARGERRVPDYLTRIWDNATDAQRTRIMNMVTTYLMAEEDRAGKTEAGR